MCSRLYGVTYVELASQLCPAGVPLTPGGQPEPGAGLQVPAHTAQGHSQRPGLRPRCKYTQDSGGSPSTPGARVLASLTSFSLAPLGHMSNPASNSSLISVAYRAKAKGKQSPSGGPSSALSPAHSRPTSPTCTAPMLS